MRTGVTVSALAHIAIIIIAVVGLNHADELKPDAVQSIAVDLVPLTAQSSMRLGSEQSKIIDTQTPSMVEDTKAATLAQPTGNTEQDQPKPNNGAKPSPQPITNSAPAPLPAPPLPKPVLPPAPAPTPAPAPKATPKPEPKPEPTPPPQPKPEPKPDTPTPTPQLAADNSQSPDAAPVVPKPATQAAIEQKRAELKQQEQAAAKAAAAAAKAEAEAKAAADAAAKAVAEKAAAQAAKAEQARRAAAAAKKLALAQQQQDKAAKVADEISSLINDAASTGAKTGSGGKPTAGKRSGTAATLTQNELAALGAQIGKCWTLLPNEMESGLSVELLFDLNKDGTVNGMPKVTQADSSSMGQSIARAAQRAVLQCGPYKLDPNKYASWSQVDVTLLAGGQ